MSTADANVNLSKILPLELVDKCVGSRVWIITRTNREVTGTLKGFDDFVNLVLDDVTEFEIFPTGRVSTSQDTILLNSNNVAMLVPGEPPYMHASTTTTTDDDTSSSSSSSTTTSA